MSNVPFTSDWVTHNEYTAYLRGWHTGYEGGFDQAVNAMHSEKEIACLDCGSTNTVAYLTVHSN